MSGFKDEIRGWPIEDRIRWEEAAGMLEFDHGHTRPRAEWLAWKQVKEERGL